MELTHIIWLALVQGLTEFLPVSSSAHLILVPRLLGWPDQGLDFDVAVHLGTLIAVVAYFRHDIVKLFLAWIASMKQRTMTPEARLAWGVILGTIPAGLVGLAFKDYIEVYLRSPMVIAVTTIIFGLLLWLADRRGKLERSEYSLNWQDFLVIGGAQAIALIPGTSRSGITITAGLLLGLTREAAARYSFLLSIPIIVLSGLSVTKDLVSAAVPVDWTALTTGTAIAAVSAFVCIHYFLAVINRMGMTPFVIYRLLLGIFLVIMVAG
ncbi:undecaprenyl-diphosphate phosphatase [Granulosicoccus antarcticus]|uniref:Undecaprenyl-diphosphatase n=1 Tax=Granulosicoccus antarcticus IMCC3135 TaxID=1192854 RepID=A0A2Z2NN76_9GAMM|nr:undecaprenyl-diphosphate phosphatase [Granulosicoccus antarcticus]ASJ71178.1 Undecaprenyl-diphosphatase [Granulosicoccus antarcticus IMCC3135]